YMTFARRWLPARQDPKAWTSGRPTLADWIETYNLAGREHRVRVTDRSPLAGKTLEQLNLRDVSGANLVAIERNGVLVQPTANSELLVGDILLVDLFAPGADAEALRQQYALEALALAGPYFTDRSQEIGMAEVILPATSGLVGETVAGARFRDRY